MFNRIFVFLFSACTFCSTGLHAQRSSDQNGTIPVFTVQKKPVTTDEFIYLYKKNHQNKKDEFTAAKIEEYLNLFINFKLKVAEARQRGLDTTQAFKKEFNSYKEELRKPYLPDSKILDSLVRLTYERMKEEVNASHILINVKPDAPPQDTATAYNKIMDLRNRAMKGEDFETLAENNSDDPSAKMNKGKLGYFTALQMVYPFETAAFQTKPGEISTPIRTSFGYHILKVNDRRLAKGEVEVSHIMIRTGENKDNTQSKNTIFDIYDQLQKGVSWNELAQQYSEDPSSKDNGGKLRPFGTGVMSAVPEFETIAFGLKNPGDMSDPFETQFGWHIVKLERKIPLATFEEMSASLKNRVSRDERVQVSKQALYAKIKKEYNYTEDATARGKILDGADTTLNTGTWNPPAFANGSSTILFKLDGKAFMINDFVNYARKNQRSNMQEPKVYLAQLLNSFVEAELLNVLEQKIELNSPDYRWLLKEYYEGILLFDIMEREVWNKASEDSVGQRNYFNTNASKYTAGERVRADIYSATTKEHIDQLKAAIGKTDSLQAITLKDSLKIKFETGLFEKDDRIVLGKVDWAPGLYVTQNNNIHYLIKIDKIEQPGQKTFEEARPEIISDYQTYLEEKWIAELKKKYPVKVNKKGKTLVMSSLENEKAK
jgi:peptidyl-prolyl cis-trans isomerase SurA